MSHKINACSVFASWRMLHASHVSVDPHPRNQLNTKDADITALPKCCWNGVKWCAWRNDVPCYYKTHLKRAAVVAQVDTCIVNNKIKYKFVTGAIVQASCWQLIVLKFNSDLSIPIIFKGFEQPGLYFDIPSFNLLFLWWYLCLSWSFSWQIALSIRDI